VDEMDFVAYSNQTPFGYAGIRWENKNSSFSLEVTVPVGSHATVYVPAEAPEQVLESGKKISEAKGVDFSRMEGGYAVFEVGSGEYKFEVVL